MNTIQKPQHGSENLSMPDLFQMEMWTSDQLSICNPTSCAVTPSATSLPASADGHSPCSSQVGQQIDQYGQEAAHASLFPQQEKDLLKPTNDISG
jgi:hypothetical protein